MTAASEDVILLDDTLTETFLTDLQSRGRTEETLKCYRNSLGKLCGFLPGRRLSHEAMRRWPEALREQGYCPSTINSAVSAANSLLAFCGRRGWQVMPAPLPETARNICVCSRPRASSKRNAPTCLSSCSARPDFPCICSMRSR